ncbi:MAG TPA: LacI family DNA-binding transcriptional regulator [Actinopolymorphaceae bacterium]|jgi:LacI family transcriptional regulator
MAAPTIYDIAREAGVSVATVSRVLNTPGRVAPATREKVLRVIELRGFVPKADAVSRARRGVGRIGVLGPFSSHEAARRRLSGMLRAAAPDLEVAVYDQESAAVSPDPLLATLPVTGHLDGLIVVSQPLEPATAARLRERGAPTLLLDTEAGHLPSVVVDDEAGGRLVASHLAELGHRRLGFLGEAQRASGRESPSSRRLAGFRAGLVKYGLRLRPTAVREASPRGRQAIAEAILLLRSANRPTAVFAADDLLAVAVMRAAAGLGLRVPDDLSVVGYDDGDLAETIGLTTVRQPLEASGELVVRLLRDAMAGNSDAGRVELRLRLIVRSTTGPAPTSPS